MRMLSTLFSGWALAAVLAGAAVGQDAVTPLMEQDPSLNNLVHAAGTETCNIGDLGRVAKVGTGPRAMILIAGSGFGGGVFDSFMKKHADRYTMYAVTLPGYGGTTPPPMPPEGTSFGDLTWHRGAQRGVEKLIEDEGLENPVVLGHWVNATVVALRLGLDRPDLVGGVVVVSGLPRYLSMMPSMPTPETPAKRAEMVDGMMAPFWFKTVTRATWDDNNFVPADYAIHPLLALRRWIEASRPTLPVHVRYLCETWAQDVTVEMDDMKVPTLVVQPGFDQAYLEMPKIAEYLEMMVHASWEGVAEKNGKVRFETIDDARVFIMDDQPERLSAVITDFVDGL